MKPASHFLLMLIPLLQLMIQGDAQCSLDSAVEQKIQSAIKELENKPRPPPPTRKLVCVSVKSRGKLAVCPPGTVVTGCACGYGCGSWDVQRETTCHCQCSGMDWTAARCCHMA
ncbi:resistin-like beta [Echinops telfairi]|uniref:Resistin-like beta n=1 Tax=Echinops telfairi TaxID=9371 RepID=A0ABM0IS62_ECHTE|nr:resistin-like beta [Echinops telfairi]